MAQNSRQSETRDRDAQNSRQSEMRDRDAQRLRQSETWEAQHSRLANSEAATEQELAPAHMHQYNYLHKNLSAEDRKTHQEYLSLKKKRDTHDDFLTEFWGLLPDATDAQGAHRDTARKLLSAFLDDRVHAHGDPAQMKESSNTGLGCVPSTGSITE